MNDFDKHGDATRDVTDPFSVAELAQPTKTPTEHEGSRGYRVWTCFALAAVVFAAIIVAQIIGVVAIMGALTAQGKELPEITNYMSTEMIKPHWVIALGLLGQLCMFFGAIFAARLSPTQVFIERLNLKRSGRSLGAYVLIAVATIFPAAIGMSLAYALTYIIPPDPSVQKLYENMTWQIALPFLLFISLAPGFAEEFLFRGFMQSRLLKRFKPWTAITITSIIFGVFHLMPHAVLFATVVGFWLGYVAWKCDSIWPAIVCHAFINGIWNIFNISNVLLDTPETYQYFVLIGATIVGLIAFVICVRGLESRPESVLASANQLG